LASISSTSRASFEPIRFRTWIAKIEVPAEGVASKTPTQKELEANLKLNPAPKEKK